MKNEGLTSEGGPYIRVRVRTRWVQDTETMNGRTRDYRDLTVSTMIDA